MTQENIRKSLFKDLDTWAAAQTPIIPVQWPNQNFTPPTTKDLAWLRPTVLFSEPEVASLGLSGTNLIKGIFHINVFFPKGELSGTPVGVAERLVQAFKRHTTTTPVSGIGARCLQSWQEAEIDRPDDKWLQIPVKVRFESTVYTT